MARKTSLLFVCHARATASMARAPHFCRRYGERSWCRCAWSLLLSSCYGMMASNSVTMASSGAVGVPIEEESRPEEASQHGPPEEETHRKQRRRSSIANTYNDVSFHPSLLKLYTPPRQRQRWGDEQTLPRVDWGDLFFDLFYVAAAYNTGNILVVEPTGTGALYFLGTFFPIMQMWNDKVYYDSRFVVGDDLFHRFFEVAVLLVVATAVLHTRPVDIMSRPSENVDMFAFSLALVLGDVLTFFRYVETYFKGKGQTEVIKKSSLRDIRFGAISFVLYLAAAIFSGIQFYSNDSDNATSYTDEHRYLAEETDYAVESDSTNIPIYLCLFGPIASYLHTCIVVMFCIPNDGSHKKYTIPINVDFSIHRNGEWIMLMLGESVLSLLIVDAPEGSDYFLAFYSGILTIILGQLLHYRSQPHHADDHAMRRSKNAGMLWKAMNQIYSAGLVLIGVAYQLFMQEFAYGEDRRLFEDWFEVGTITRALAGGASSLDPEERRQNTAHLFCIAVATVWISHDTMLFLHYGWHKMEQRCHCPDSSSRKVDIKVVILLFLRFCLLAFISTISQWETDPAILSVLGLVGVLANLILRVIGSIVVPECQVHLAEEEHVGAEEDEEADPEKNKWPNVTHAAIKKAGEEEVAE